MPNFCLQFGQLYRRKKEALMPSPIRDLSPLLSFLVVAFATVGVVMLLRVGVERRFYWTRWNTFRWGDIFGLAMFSGFASAAIDTPSGHPSWHWIVWTIFMSVWIANEYSDVVSKNRPLRNVFLPSQVYHTLIFGFAGTWIVDAVVALFLEPFSVWTALAFVSLAFYVFTAWLDRNGWEKYGPEQIPRVH